MAKRETYSGPMQPYMLPELDSNLASYMRNDPALIYATQLQMRTATPRQKKPLTDSIGSYGGYSRIYANYPKPEIKPVKTKEIKNFGNTMNPNLVESYNDFGEPDMGGYMRNRKRKTSITGRSASKNMHKTSYKKFVGPSGPFVEPSIRRNLTGNEMQRYLESKALSPEQLRAELASKRKDFDASGKYTGMRDFKPNWDAMNEYIQRMNIINAYRRKNPGTSYEDASEYLFPRYDFEAIRNKSLEALRNSPNGYIQSNTPYKPSQPSQPSQPSTSSAASAASAVTDTSNASVAQNPFSNTKKNPYAFADVFNIKIKQRRRNPSTNASNNLFADSAMFGEPQNPRKTRNLFNASTMFPRLGKSMSKRAIPTQRTANTKNKYGI